MFDKDALRLALADHGPVARVVVAAVVGSGPREVGAAMLVWATGQSGTIGGGALEWQAVLRARSLLPLGGSRIDRAPLGPALGQCCGGAVTLVTEVYDRVPGGSVIARSVAGQSAGGQSAGGQSAGGQTAGGQTAGGQTAGGQTMPLAVKRLLAAARGQGVQPAPQLKEGWMVEPVLVPARCIWVWGAGHVGRALVSVLHPFPDVALTWVDIASERFPDLPAGVRALPVPDPATAVSLAPTTAEHLIVTFSHALDLELCHRLLDRGFASCGLIGSATKWARFRGRLAALGHSADQFARITCPIGDPSLGKHPQAIALGVAAALLRSGINQTEARHAMP